MAANVLLWMPIDGEYRPVLSIPVNECRRFSVNPYIWLRYVGFTIYGNEGHISMVPGGSEIPDYRAWVSPGNYYYVSQNPRLLDPDLMDDRTSTASDVAKKRHDFRRDVKNRDGGVCVVTAGKTTQACHIIPHAKGSQYLVNLINHRGKEIIPPLTDIDDTRNGILLAVQLHSAFGTSEVAFLRTPNFAMAVHDVDLEIQPLYGLLNFATHPSLAATRLSFHNFRSNDPLLEVIAPHNSAAKQSNSDTWPPDLLFDVAYGSAALRTWGVTGMIEYARKATKDAYYNNVNGEESDNNDKDSSTDSDEDRHDQARLQQNRTVRSSDRGKQPVKQKKAQEHWEEHPVDLVIALWLQGDKERRLQAEEMQMERSRQKVQKWLQST